MCQKLVWSSALVVISVSYNIITNIKKIIRAVKEFNANKIILTTSAKSNAQKLVATC